MSQFSTNAEISLEKKIGNTSKYLKCAKEKLFEVYEIDKCAKWVEENNFQKVCLQFPDSMLIDSYNIATELEKIIKRKVYILGDTSYDSCCVDFVAAQHVSADALIHFGTSCFSTIEDKVPVLTILEKKTIDFDLFFNIISKLDSYDECMYIVCDNTYGILIEQLKEKCFSSGDGNKIEKYIISVQEYKKEFSEKVTIYLGNSGRSLMNFYYIHKCSKLHYFNPDTNVFEKFTENNKAYKRRFYLIEKIKDSKMIGIVVATLAVKNYLKIIERIKSLCKLHGKKNYIISVGKPNVAKLANFPEIDIFVVIACPQCDLYDSRDFYKPIVSPFDIEVALNPNANCTMPEFDQYDYNEILLGSGFSNLPLKIEIDSCDVSLISGQIRTKENNELNDEQLSNSNELEARKTMQVVLNDSHGAGYLAARTWKGLEQNLGDTEVKLAEMGRKGTAKEYDNEKS